MVTRDDTLLEELRTLADRTRSTPKEVAAAAARLAGVAIDDHPHHRPLSESELITKIEEGLDAARREDFVACTAQSIIAEANGRTS